MPETPRSAKRRRLNDSTVESSPPQSRSIRKSAKRDTTVDDLEVSTPAGHAADAPDSSSKPKRNGTVRQTPQKAVDSALTSQIPNTSTPQRSSTSTSQRRISNGQKTTASENKTRKASRNLGKQEKNGVENDSERDELALSSSDIRTHEEAVSSEAEMHSPKVRTSGRVRKSTVRALESESTPKRTSTKPRAKRNATETAAVVSNVDELANEDELAIRSETAPIVAQPEDPDEHMEVDDGEEPIIAVGVGSLELDDATAVCSDAEFAILQTIVLSKLAQRRPTPLTNLSSEYAKLHQLLHATVTAGESNSMLLIGARGSGKTAMVNQVLQDLARSQKEYFHTVRLNGFMQTDDKLALREIWRQLGREMEISEFEDGGGKSYADTLAMLLALLSHPDEIGGMQANGVAKSVIFIMDEFDLFASHARQTLLYNLLDIAQSRKAPIAVIGLTTRIDVTEALEKRVKSRFSHRYLHLALPKTLSEFVNIGKAAVKIGPDELTFDERAILLGGAGPSDQSKSQATSHSALAVWNHAVESFFAAPSFLQTIVQPIYYTTKSVPTLLSSLLLTISSLSTLPTPEQFSSAGKAIQAAGLLTPPDSSLHLVPSLSELGLALLIAAARLSIIHATDTTNFALAYAEYISLASKARINSAASGALASGAGTRVFGKEVARGEWDRLIRYGLLVPITSGAYGLGSGGTSMGAKGVAEMVRVDVALEEIPMCVDMGSVMDKWCRQI